jgi:hypothetical protein
VVSFTISHSPRFLSRGRTRESLKSGKKYGPWVFCHDYGKLSEEGAYKNGKKEGLWALFKKDRTVLGPFTGTFKDGKKVSDKMKTLTLLITLAISILFILY